jgi:TetR/AcrR family transcriptional regulator
MATRDAAATKRRIAQAALKEFAAKGIAGARVDAIATRARTNKRMLYYYFGSKEGLFKEILRQRLAARHDQRAAVEGLSYGERLAARQARQGDLREHVRLLMWEALETRSRRQPVMAEEERTELYADLRALVVEAQEAGEVPADLDPGQLVLSELALTLFPIAFPQITRLVTGHSVDDPAFVEERAAFLVRLGDSLSPRRVGR